jgi:hypothetical protein
MSKNIYRLVKPYQSNKVYEALTVMHGAGKCYKELKKSNVNCESFSIMDINSNSIYEFNIKPKNEMILKKDPSELLKKDPYELLKDSTKINQNGGDELFQIKNEIEQLKNRISTLEGKINFKI